MHSAAPALVNGPLYIHFATFDGVLYSLLIATMPVFHTDLILGTLNMRLKGFPVARQLWNRKSNARAIVSNKATVNFLM